MPTSPIEYPCLRHQRCLHNDTTSRVHPYTFHSSDSQQQNGHEYSEYLDNRSPTFYSFCHLIVIERAIVNILSPELIAR